MKQLFDNIQSEAYSKGFILLPKVLLEKLQKQQTGGLSYTEAIITLMINVNYSDTKVVLHGQEYTCKRGASMRSMAHWAQLFHWKVTKTRRFIESLIIQGFLGKVENKYTTHIYIRQYDFFTCKEVLHKKGKSRSEEMFDLFWQKYHEHTQLYKTEIGAARREWQKLTVNERELAIANIENYYYSLSDVKFCKKAHNYLADKSFLNEFQSL